MKARQAITLLIEEIAFEQNRTVSPLTDDLILANSGLDSLCLAILVARLEDMIGIDPFTENENARFPATLKDLIELYGDR